jgi:di/tricarboxylate transporter
MNPLSLWDSLSPVQQGEAMASATVLVFALTYVGMALGRIPGLRVDRSGIAMVAAVVLVAMGATPTDQIVKAIHFPTLLLMGGLMILSARFRAAGFYDAAASWIPRTAGQPLRLLALTILISGVLSALLINDIVVFAMTPILCTGLAARKLNPRPFLFGLAAGSNAGSAATLIGNPQNILIGQVGRLDFLELLANGDRASFDSHGDRIRVHRYWLEINCTRDSDRLTHQRLDELRPPAGRHLQSCLVSASCLFHNTGSARDLGRSCGCFPDRQPYSSEPPASGRD